MLDKNELEHNVSDPLVAVGNLEKFDKKSYPTPRQKKWC